MATSTASGAGLLRHSVAFVGRTSESQLFCIHTHHCIVNHDSTSHPHTPHPQISDCVHVRPSSHANVLFVYTISPVVGSHVSVVHSFPSVSIGFDIYTNSSASSSQDHIVHISLLLGISRDDCSTSPVVILQIFSLQNNQLSAITGTSGDHVSAR